MLKSQRRGWLLALMLLLGGGLIFSESAVGDHKAGHDSGGKPGEDEPPPDPGISYQIVRLAFPGHEDEPYRVHGINNYGDVLGTNGSGTLQDGVGDRTFGEFVYHAESDTLLPLNMLIEDWFIMRAGAINDAGQIGAQAVLDTDDTEGFNDGDLVTAVRLTPVSTNTTDPLYPYDQGFVVEEVGIGQADGCAVTGINNDGDVVGYRWKDGDYQGFLVQDFPEGTSVMHLGFFNGDGTIPEGISDRDANDDVIVVGAQNDVAWQFRPSQADLGAVALPRPYGGSSDAVDISANGIVGGALDFDTGYHAARYSDSGGWQDLGTLAADHKKINDSSWAYGISNDGSFVVGRSYAGSKPNDNTVVPFLYHDEFGMVDVTSLIVSGSFSGVVELWDVNDNGWICGDDWDSVFVLVPQ